jgi:hypothetical protein
MAGTEPFSSPVASRFIQALLSRGHRHRQRVVAGACGAKAPGCSGVGPQLKVGSPVMATALTPSVREEGHSALFTAEPCSPRLADGE